MPKVATGIAGLDAVLEGGLPRGKVTLVGGGPGSGKTVLGLEFLYRGALAGEAGIFLSFEESAEAVRRNALAMGWDLAALEKEGTLFLMGVRISPEAVLAGQFDLKALFAILEGKAQHMQAGRIVVDAFDVLLQLFDDLSRERDELYRLHAWLQARQLTAILSVKEGPGAGPAGRYQFLEYLTDCVLRLDQRVSWQRSTRRLRVLKYRGSGFGRNEYPFVIERGGLALVPITTVELHHAPPGEPVSSGLPWVDRILGGGFRRNSSVIISGTSGTGKTSLACTFVQAACARGEKVLYLDFEESREALVRSMLSPGIDLRPALEAGKLEIRTAMPEGRGAEEHLLHILRAMDRFAPNHLVVDAVSACERMGGPDVAFDFGVRLLDQCKRRNVTCLLTNQIRGMLDVQEMSGMGLSSVMDTVVLLTQHQQDREVGRRVLVLKSRGVRHSSGLHEFRITDRGLAPGGESGAPAGKTERNDG